jgi:hypothetical protein
LYSASRFLWWSTNKFLQPSKHQILTSISKYRSLPGCSAIKSEGVSIILGPGAPISTAFIVARYNSRW